MADPGLRSHPVQAQAVGRKHVMGHLDREAQGLYAYIRQASVESIAYFHAVYGVAGPSHSTSSADPKHHFSTQSQRALRAQGLCTPALPGVLPPAHV